MSTGENDSPVTEIELREIEDEIGSEGLRADQATEASEVQRRAKRSPILKYFTLVGDSIYACELCRSKNVPKEVRVKRPADGSTSVFWRHFRFVHPKEHDALKGSSSKQQCLDDLRDDVTSSTLGGRRPLRGRTPEETKDTLSELICCTDLPWRWVDSPAWKKMWRYATQSEVSSPSARVIKPWTMKLFERMKADIIHTLSNVDRVSVTTDAWTAENGCGLLGVTVHWIDDRWTYRESVLAVRELCGKHDGASMAEILVDVLEEFGLDSKVNNDNRLIHY